jgi:hypothetical protein
MPDSSQSGSATVWDKAVEIVDGRHGYTVEFAPNPAAHRAEYDAEYRRLRREEMKEARRG